MAVAIVHFIRRRPDTYWIFIILFLGWIGAAVYIVAEVIPDAGLLRKLRVSSSQLLQDKYLPRGCSDATARADE